ncbi:RNA methyltransferase, TrmH family, group 1 [Crinalium epipsammum PCC 9333]|uniref:tRNA (cytidine/uridine-2'-O-)-methyltransferase TrmJ n=1 Tax=Crinalium epipsammum PCC 9333 TaxID=1173022 RepID=K9VYD5_9CYAN|nr:RNA methyltransferase [Crinalium epipsammum]AFZ12170.1 RNA methyltransferase, TrmH family, group 1 [Crinalium epipsammum PCC 9333]
MNEQALARVRIVLVEPAGGLNVGAIARVIKNMGLQQLVLVNPKCDRLGEDACKMAVHAVDILENAKIVATMPEALKGCQRAIATTARSRAIETPLETPRTVLPWLLEAPVQSALIFGPEDRGLSNTELNYAQRFLRIPSNPEYPVLNLAQSVGICAYELTQVQQQLLTRDQQLVAGDQVLTSSASKSPSATAASYTNEESDRADLDHLEGYYQQMEAVLLNIGYLYPHTAASRMEKLRRIFNRAGVTTAEVAMLRGIFSQMEWKLTFLPPDTTQP